MGVSCRDGHSSGLRSGVRTYPPDFQQSKPPASPIRKIWGTFWLECALSDPGNCFIYRPRSCCLSWGHDEYSEVEGISFVGYTGVEGVRPRLWNLQNLCPVPPLAGDEQGLVKVFLLPYFTEFDLLPNTPDRHPTIVATIPSETVPFFHDHRDTARASE